jgi:hypothetical protein
MGNFFEGKNLAHLSNEWIKTPQKELMTAKT